MFPYVAITTAQIQIQDRVCEKVASDMAGMVLGGGFHRVRRFPLPLASHDS